MAAMRLMWSCLARAGVGTLVRTARRAVGSPGRGLVLMYHRVASEADYLGLCVSPSSFSTQVAVLKRRASVVPLRDLVARLAVPEPLDHDIAAITFDDGYRDNLEIALPILARHEVTATVFVTTGFVDGSARPVGERIEDAARKLWGAARPAAAWDAGGDDQGDMLVRSVLSHPGSLDHLRALAQWFVRVDARNAEALLNRLEDLAGTARSTSSRMLDWQGVRTLAREGVEIASHTESHPILSRVSRVRAQTELVASKQRLESEIDREVTGFAFPNGQAGDFSDDDVAAVRGAGYAYACTAERGVNRSGADPYRILRVGVGDYGSSMFDFKVAVGR